MWQRFTERARRIVFFSQKEAGQRGQHEVAPEHLFLAILREEDSVAIRVLKGLDVNPERLAEAIRRKLPAEAEKSSLEMQLSARGKLAIDYAYDEARRLNNNYIGTEHLLLGLMREEGGSCAEALSDVNVDLARVRTFVAKFQESSSLEAARDAASLATFVRPIPEEARRLFNSDARRAVVFASEEAGRLKEPYYSTEHLLLGLLRASAAITINILADLDLSPQMVKDDLERQVSLGPVSSNKEIVAAPRAERVFSLARHEASVLNDDFIGPEHLLLALIREGEGLAGRVLTRRGASLTSARDAVIKIRKAPQVDRIVSGSRLDKEIEKLRKRLQNLPSEPVAEEPTQASVWDVPMPIFGDLGIASPTPGRNQIEVAHDAAAFRRLLAIFVARDAHGYRTLTEGDQTVFLLPAGTRLKILVPPPDTDDVFEESYHVRVLEGEYSGYAGWIFKSAFHRTGFDDSPFPPAY